MCKTEYSNPRLSKEMTCYKAFLGEISVNIFYVNIFKRIHILVDIFYNNYLEIL